MPNNIHLIQDTDFNNKILNEAPGSEVGKLKRGILSANFVAILMKEFSKTFRMAAFPLLGVLSLVSTFLTFREKFNNRNTSKGSYLYNLGLTALFMAAEITALVLGLVATSFSLLIAGPIIFTAITFYNVISSFIDMVNHAAHVLYLRLSKKDNYSIEYQEHVKGFWKSGLSLILNSIVLIGTVTTMLAPYVPAIAGIFGAAFGAVTFAFQIASASVLGVGFLAVVDDFIGKHLSKKGTGLIPRAINYINEKLFNKSDEPTISKTVSDEYSSPGKFSTLDSHVEDLQIKMEVMHEEDKSSIINEVQLESKRISNEELATFNEAEELKKRAERLHSKNARSYQLMQGLFTREREKLAHLPKNHDKVVFLETIESAVLSRDDAKPNKDLFLSAVNNYGKNLRNITTSFFNEDDDGMKKLLVVANQYCGFFIRNPFEAKPTTAVTQSNPSEESVPDFSVLNPSSYSGDFSATDTSLDRLTF